MTDTPIQTIPFSLEAEEATIGAVLMNGRAYTDLSSFLVADDFFIMRHRWIWEAFTQLNKDKLIIDIGTVCEELRTKKHLDEIGGYAYIIQLVSNTPNSMHGEAYGRLVQRTSTRRKLMIAADKIKAAAQDESKNIETVLVESESAIHSAGNRHIERKGEWVTMPTLRVWQAMKRLYAGESVEGLKTGYENIDGVLSGLQPDDLVILAARPGMGKTSLLLNILLNIAQRGIPVGMFTMEMSTDRLVSRLYALLSGVSTTKQKTRGLCTAEDVKSLAKAKDILEELPIYITDEPSPTPRQIMTIGQRLVNIEGAGILFVDGLYRMSPDYDTRGDETAAYSQIAKSLKTMARTLRVPLIVTHQLNRELEKRSDKRPMMSDLRQSGRIEEEADIVTFLYRDVVYNPSSAPNEAEFITAKNRDGGVGTTKLWFEPTLTKFEDSVHVLLDEKHA